MLERRGDKITSCYQSTTSYARDTSTDALELSERREMMLIQIEISMAAKCQTMNPNHLNESIYICNQSTYVEKLNYFRN